MVAFSAILFIAFRAGHVTWPAVRTSGAGLVVFVCAMRGDDQRQSESLARKTINLRLFRDDDGRMNRSVLDVAER